MKNMNMKVAKSILDLLSEQIDTNDKQLNVSTMILATALITDVMLQFYEDKLHDKYRNVLIPFSQSFRSIDVISLPVLDSLIDPRHEIKYFDGYSTFKKQMKLVYEPMKSSDENVESHKKWLYRNKNDWKKIINGQKTKHVLPYSEMILDSEENLFYPIESKQLIIMFMRYLPQKLPLICHELRRSKSSDLSNTLDVVNALIQQFRKGLDDYREAQQKLLQSEKKWRPSMSENMLGELIFAKKLEKILPFSQIKACNDSDYYRNLADFKNDFNCILPKAIDKQTDLYFAKIFLGVLLYSLSTDNNLNLQWKHFLAEMIELENKLKRDLESQNIDSIMQYFNTPMIKSFISTFNCMDFSSLQYLYDPMKIFSYIRILNVEPLSRISNIHSINKKFEFLLR